jgi:hypothetical protein
MGQQAFPKRAAVSAKRLYLSGGKLNIPAMLSDSERTPFKNVFMISGIQAGGSDACSCTSIEAFLY